MKSNQLLPPSWWQESITAWNELQHYFQPNKNAQQAILRSQNWQAISRGQTNHSFKLNFQKQPFFIQVINQNKSQLQPTVNFKELNVLLQQNHTINPWLIECYFESSHIKIQDWLTNTPLTNQVFNQKRFIEELAKFMAALHDEKFLTEIDKKTLPVIQIEEYLSRYKKLAIKYSPSQHEKINSLYKQSISLIPFFNHSAFCHNDLSLDNLLWTSNQKLKVIDWEYSGLGDSVMDIANLSLMCQLTSHQEAALLAEYSRISKKTISLSKFSCMKKLANIISELWYLAQ